MSQRLAKAGSAWAVTALKRVSPSNSAETMRPSAWLVMIAGSSDSGSGPLMTTKSAGSCC